MAAFKQNMIAKAAPDCTKKVLSDLIYIPDFVNNIDIKSPNVFGL